MKDLEGVEHYHERADHGEMILHAIRRAVDLEFNNNVSLLDFIEERWISDEMIGAMVRSLNEPGLFVMMTQANAKRARVAMWRVLNRLDIFQCEACEGEGKNYDPSGKTPDYFCCSCNGIGATRGKHG